MRCLQTCSLLLQEKLLSSNCSQAGPSGDASLLPNLRSVIIELHSQYAFCSPSIALAVQPFPPFSPLSVPAMPTKGQR